MQCGCSLATLARRLERGRELLKARLTRRGVALSAAALLVLTSGLVAAAVPRSLVVSTSQAAAVVAASGATASAVPPGAAALTEGVLRTMRIAKLKVGAAVLLVAALITGVGAAIGARAPGTPVTARAAGEDKPEKPTAPPPARVLKGEHWPKHLSWSSDGNVLAATTMDATQVGGMRIEIKSNAVRVWDVRTGKLERTLADDPYPDVDAREQRGAFWAWAAASPDGKTVAAASWGKFDGGSEGGYSFSGTPRPAR
jgi:hypothetical protein